MATKEYDQKLNDTSLIWSAFCLSDSILTGAIYTCYSFPALTLLYRSTLMFAFFPMFVLNSAVTCVCAWYWAHLERNIDGTMKEGKIVNAAIITLASIFMLGAAVFGLSAQFASTFLSPAFFAANMITSSFFNIGASIFYWGKSKGTPEPALLENPSLSYIVQNKKKIYRDRAIGHAQAGLIGATISVTALLVVVFAQTALAPIGIAMAICGSIVHLKAIYNTAKEKIRLKKAAQEEQAASQQEAPLEEAPGLSARYDTTGIRQALNAQPATLNNVATLSSRSLEKEFDEALEQADFITPNEEYSESMDDDAPLLRSLSRF